MWNTDNCSCVPLLVKVVFFNELPNFSFSWPVVRIVQWEHFSGPNVGQMSTRRGDTVWKKVSENISNGRFHCVDTVSDGLPSFAWLQRFCCAFAIFCLMWVKRELEQQIRMATHTQCMLIVWARSMGMTYFLSSASWTATAGHINSPNGTLHPPKYVIIIIILLGRREEGIGSFWLFTLIAFWVVSCHVICWNLEKITPCCCWGE